jgi:DNA-binding MarR family transcriptional regulator
MSSIMRESVDHVNQPTADDVLEAVHAVMHAVRAAHHAAGPDALAPMEARVLSFFARRPGATASELAAHSGRDKGQLARLVAQLRTRGLLEAQEDAEDRRSVRLQPTAAGRTAHQALQRQRRKLAALAAAGLSEAETRQLVSLLARVRANLEG